MKQRIDHCFFKEYLLQYNYTGEINFGGAFMQLNLGQKIRELRHRDGRTQETLAEAMGIKRRLSGYGNDSFDCKLFRCFD